MRRLRSRVVDEYLSESGGLNVGLGGKGGLKRATTWRELIEEEEVQAGSGGEESEEGD